MLHLPHTRLDRSLDKGRLELPVAKATGLTERAAIVLFYRDNTIILILILCTSVIFLDVFSILHEHQFQRCSLSAAFSCDVNPAKLELGTSTELMLKSRQVRTLVVCSAGPRASYEGPSGIREKVF